MAATAQAPASGPRQTLLARVTRGRITAPVRVVLYGPEGVGKSTWAAQAPAALFVGAEDGTAQLDVARVEPRDWRETLAIVEELRGDASGFQSIVIDTIDWLEPHCWAEVVRAEAARPRRSGSAPATIEDFGYGRGYAVATDAWRTLLGALDALRREQRMHVILLAHAHVRRHQSPTFDDFDRWELKLHKGAAALVKEWSDVVLFASHEEYVTKSETGRVRGVSTGARVVHTTHSAAYDAKSRYPLPETMPLEWAEFWAGVQSVSDDHLRALRSRIQELAAAAAPEVGARALAAMERVGRDAGELARIASKLAAMTAAQQPSDNQETP